VILLSRDLTKNGEIQCPAVPIVEKRHDLSERVRLEII